MRRSKGWCAAAIAARIRASSAGRAVGLLAEELDREMQILLPTPRSLRERPFFIGAMAWRIARRSRGLSSSARKRRTVSAIGD